MSPIGVVVFVAGSLILAYLSLGAITTAILALAGEYDPEHGQLQDPYLDFLLWPLIVFYWIRSLFRE